MEQRRERNFPLFVELGLVARSSCSASSIRGAMNRGAVFLPSVAWNSPSSSSPSFSSHTFSTSALSRASSCTGCGAWWMCRATRRPRLDFFSGHLWCHSGGQHSACCEVTQLVVSDVS